MRPFPNVNGGYCSVEDGGTQPLWARSPGAGDCFTGLSPRGDERQGQSGLAGAPPRAMKLFDGGRYSFGGGEAFGRAYATTVEDRLPMVRTTDHRVFYQPPGFVVVQNWLEELRASVRPRTFAIS